MKQSRSSLCSEMNIKVIGRITVLLYLQLLCCPNFFVIWCCNLTARKPRSPSWRWACVFECVIAECAGFCKWISSWLAVWPRSPSCDPADVAQWGKREPTPALNRLHGPIRSPACWVFTLNLHLTPAESQLLNIYEEKHVSSSAVHVCAFVSCSWARFSTLRGWNVIVPLRSFMRSFFQLVSIKT